MFKRDPEYVSSKIFKKDDKIFCSENCIIEYPAWYEEKGLGTSQDVVSYYGIVAIILGERYAVSVIPTLCNSSPVAIGEVEREGVVYKQLMFGKGDCIINSSKVVKVDILSYNFFETFYMRARVPWYVGYEDLVKVMDRMSKYSGSGLGGDPIASEVTTSFITRRVDDKLKFYRETGGKGEYVYVDLMNVYYSAFGAVNSIVGNYLKDGIVSSLVQRSKTDTKLEKHLRG